MSTPEEQFMEGVEEQEEMHRERQGPGEPPIRVMVEPTTCGVTKFPAGQRVITLTQQGIELTWPLSPEEATQLSKKLAPDLVKPVGVGEARAAGLRI